MSIDLKVISHFDQAMRIVNGYQDITNLRDKFRKWDNARRMKYIAHVQKLAATQPDKFPLFVKLTLEFTIIRMES